MSGRQQVREILRPELVHFLLSIIGRDAEMEEISQAENLTAQLLIRFDRRRRGGELGAERLKQLSLNLLEGEEDGFVIETTGGEEIRSSNSDTRFPHED